MNKKNTHKKIKWYIIDATNKILGRLASKTVKYLIGKHKPEYSFNKNIGDYIIIINAKKIKITGNKKNKTYYYHTGYPGGIKKQTFKEIQNKNPIKIIQLAIKRMLPKNSLGRKMYKKLKIYPNKQHKHTAQTPKTLKI